MNDKTESEVAKRLEDAGLPNPHDIIGALKTLFDGKWQPRKDKPAIAYLVLVALPGIVALAHSYGLV